MKQAYIRLVKYVTERVPEGSVEFQFIDIVENDIYRFPYALKCLQMGYKPPLTVINGIIKFCGGIKYDPVYRQIVIFLNN